MDKRKQSSPDGRISKRRRHTPSVSPEAEDEPSSPGEVARRILDILYEEKDRRGNQIVEAFKELPKKEDIPDYYSVIKNPVALDTIEGKLKKYRTVEEVVEDFDLMTSNAQEYNRPNSAVYTCAVKIHNIVHKYVADHVKDYQVPERRSGRTLRRATSAQADTDNEEIKEALVAVLREMTTEVKDKNGYGAADHFLELPLKRQFPDYYAAIKYPISIKEIRRKLKRDDYKGPGLMDNFEAEITQMFANAADYNEEGSDILDDAQRLKEFFYPRMAEERKRFGKLPMDMSRVTIYDDEDLMSPGGEHKIKIHLNVPEPNGIKLKINNRSKSEAESTEDKMDIDDSAPVIGKTRSASANGAAESAKDSIAVTRSPKKQSPPMPATNQHSTRSSSLQPKHDAKVGSASPAPTTRASQSAPSPAPGLGQGTTAATARSPNPSSAAPVPQPSQSSTPAPRPQASFGDLKGRAKGKTIHDSPIQRLHIQTSQRIQTRERTDISLWPDEKFWFTSSTMHLSSENNILTVTAYMHPKICSKETLSATTLTLNGNRLKQIDNPQAPNGAIYSWELPLTRGTTNSIECTCTMQNSPENTDDVEKVHFVIFAYLSPKL